ncbi:MAG TPA: Ig-like domain-containing protein, partial [Lachnospiraceae bacterium]|nr:Ig-like domain-containing protein [Lachnospiraceae bacterium]
YAENNKLLTEDIPASEAVHVMNNIKVEDGVLNVSVKASAGNNNAAVMSWIAIYPHYQTTNTLTFTQGGYIVEKGKTFLLPYSVTPSSTGVTFASSNEGVATVAADGTVTAIGYGSTTITAIAGDAMAKCVIIVPEGANGVSGTDTASVGYGKTTVLTYSVAPENAVNKNLIITSSDPSKIQIMSTQRVGAITYVTIKASAEAGDSVVVKATLESNPTSFKETVVTVSDLKIESIQLDKTTLALTANGDASIASGSAIGAGFVREGSVQAEFLVDGELCPVNRNVEWTIVNGSDCIDIEPSGNQVVVKSKKVGEADVLARIETLPGSLEYVEKMVHITITAEALVISSVDAPVNVITVIGKQPVLPTTVRVHYTNSSYGDVNVSWDSYNQDSLYSLGDFTVNGTITGTTEAVSVTVTVDQKSIKDTDIKGISSQVYKDKPVTLPIAIYDGAKLLIEGTDYTLAYHNNDKAGDATVVIQGINMYNDTISYDFSIQKEVVSQPVSISKPKPQIKLIQVTQLPSILYYIEGETLDSTGLALAISYDDGSTDIITGGFTINDTSLTKVGTKVISVSYQGYVATFEVYVREKQVIQVEKSIGSNETSV